MTEINRPFDPRGMKKFREFLEKQPGPMADGYADFAALMEWADRTQAMEGATAQEKAAAHLYHGLTYAFVEIMQAGVARGLDPLDLIHALPKVCGGCAMNTIACAVDDGAPWRKLAKMMNEGFAFGTKYGADLLIKSEKSSPDA